MLRLRPDLCTTLFQKVIVSCQHIYHMDGIELLTDESVYKRFTELGFYTPDPNPVLAMNRRFRDMMPCGLLERIKGGFELTPLGKRIIAHHAHIVASLQIKDCTKNSDMPRRGPKKERSDKIRTFRDIIEVKSENKVLNTTLIDKKAPPIDSEYMNGKFVYDITSNINISKGESIVVTMKDGKITHIDIFKKHTRLQHIKSLFGL